MDFDADKVDEAVLAILYLTLHDDGPEYGARAWKGHDWDAMDRLFQKGYIADPKNKNKSVIVTVDGKAKSRELFFKLFGKNA